MGGPAVIRPRLDAAAALAFLFAGSGRSIATGETGASNGSNGDIANNAAVATAQPSQPPASGQLVWAKHERQPWWPAVVLPADHAQRPPASRMPAADAVPVWFFGTHEAVAVHATLVSGWDVDLEARRRKKVANFAQALREGLRYQAVGERLGGGLRLMVTCDLHCSCG